MLVYLQQWYRRFLLTRLRIPLKKYFLLFNSVTNVLVHVHGCPRMEIAASFESI
jgi:hypothetical protein